MREILLFIKQYGLTTYVSICVKTIIFSVYVAAKGKLKGKSMRRIAIENRQGIWRETFLSSDYDLAFKKAMLQVLEQRMAEHLADERGTEREWIEWQEFRRGVVEQRFQDTWGLMEDYGGAIGVTVEKGRATVEGYETIQ